MTENSVADEAASPPLSGNANDHQAIQAASAPKPRSGGIVLGIFSLLLSIAALAAAGYIWFTQQVSHQQSTSSLMIDLTEARGDVKRLEDELARLSTAQQGLMSRDAMTLEINSALAETREQQQQLTDSVAKLNSDVERGLDAWVLEEVEQLLRLANRGLALNGDIDSARTALSLADGELRGLGDPRYLKVRSAIADELGALSEIEPPDVAGLANRLSTLHARIPGLPLINEPDRTPIEADSPPAEAPDWKRELYTFFNDLIGIQIQKVDQAPRPLLAPEQRYFLEQNVQMMINGAKLALLQAKPRMFKHDLGQAIEWTESYFDRNQPAVDKVLSELEALRDTDIEIEYPDISGSLSAFEQVGRSAPEQ